jgi:hypothetical protein
LWHGRRRDRPEFGQAVNVAPAGHAPDRHAASRAPYALLVRIMDYVQKFDGTEWEYTGDPIAFDRPKPLLKASRSQRVKAVNFIPDVRRQTRWDSSAPFLRDTFERMAA